MLIVVPQAAGRQAVPNLPSNLHAFLLRANEPIRGDHTYAEMPAFAWNPVAGAKSYELQLADNSSFSDVSVLYESSTLTAPVASIQLQVPWMTGDPYALWVHVRAVVNGTTTGWSKPFGFNTSWQSTPTEESSPTGLIRWSPVEGATSYQVWYTNIGRVFPTLTNVADEREFWTFHPGLAGIIRWRVRAERYTANAALPSGLAITKYGPWSAVFTTLTPGAIKPAPLKGVATISDVNSNGPHALMPGFAWTGTDGIGPAAIGQQLWRVYVFSDRACVNQVMVGSVTGGQAWAPRATESLALPGTVQAVSDAETKGTILKPGSEGATFMADLTAVTASEDVVPGGASPGAATPPGAAPSGAAPPGATPSGNGTTTEVSTPGEIELPDSGWPSGRYWWTVVPVDIVDIPPADGSASSPKRRCRIPRRGASARCLRHGSGLVVRDAERPDDRRGRGLSVRVGTLDQARGRLGRG